VPIPTAIKSLKVMLNESDLRLIFRAYAINASYSSTSSQHIINKLYKQNFFRLLRKSDNNFDKFNIIHRFKLWQW